jgi:hypothetical protein
VRRGAQGVKGWAERQAGLVLQSPVLQRVRLGKSALRPPKWLFVQPCAAQHTRNLVVVPACCILWPLPACAGLCWRVMNPVLTHLVCCCGGC